MRFALNRTYDSDRTTCCSFSFSPLFTAARFVTVFNVVPEPGIASSCVPAAYNARVVCGPGAVASKCFTSARALLKVSGPGVRRKKYGFGRGIWEVVGGKVRWTRRAGERDAPESLITNQSKDMFPRRIWCNG